MINDVLNGVSNALYDAFDIKNIYLETVNQGFKKPCFFIMLVNEKEHPLLGNRAQREILLDVHFFTNNGKEEALQVASKLYSVLRCIQLHKYDEETETLIDTDQLNGFNLNYEIIDNVLHFFVTYKPIIYYSKNVADSMEELTKTVEVAHGN